MNVQVQPHVTTTQRHLPFECVALVLQGGGALGAYQAGVYEALLEAGIHPDWIAGISIGAINAAIIAGNPPNSRVDRLREFWTQVTADGLWPFLGEANLGLARGDAARNFLSQMSATMALANGASGFFAARPVTPWLQPGGTIEATSFYDTKDLKLTLEHLVDFDRLNAGIARFSVGSVNVRTGNFVYFDSATHTIRPEQLRIEDYALIGDRKTAALVGRDGSIDWLCWPRFDSAACFAALLGKTDNGRWLIAPKDPSISATRRYHPGTLILETEFQTETGSAAVVDFMPPVDGAHLVRIVVGRSGRVDFQTELVVRFNYGAAVPWVDRLGDGWINAIAGPERLLLRTRVALYGEDLKTIGEFALEAGQSIPFVLSYGASFQNPSPAIDPFDALARTEAFWREWSDRCPDIGPWTDAVKRSLITLKALTYAPTGGIVAAATTSLPERLGGVRNWDYRYCWLRDATFTLLAFMNLGYYEEARAWRDWLVRAVAGSPSQVQIMYGVGGERWLPELTVPWLPGYENSAPVRIGNGASEQLQLDVFGEIADAMFQGLKAGMAPSERGHALRPVVLEYLATAWRQPDEGIWEVRGDRQHFVHSKVMAWVAFDRAANELETRAFNESGRRWREIADEIHAEVCERGFDRDLNSFVQAYGSKQLDASLLLIPMVGFLSPEDPRVRGTLQAIEDRLLIRDEFVLRYETEHTGDGLPAGEGAFLACSFWLVDNYILQGRHREACKLFTRLLSRCNDVGLLAEELDPLTGRMLGNFPQAYSHVGLINCALNLSRQKDPTEKRAEPQTSPITVASTVE